MTELSRVRQLVLLLSEEDALRLARSLGWLGESTIYVARVGGPVPRPGAEMEPVDLSGIWWWVPRPGSDAAIRRGCTCAADENRDGAGLGGQDSIFAVAEDCPLHADSE